MSRLVASQIGSVLALLFASQVGLACQSPGIERYARLDAATNDSVWTNYVDFQLGWFNLSRNDFDQKLGQTFPHLRYTMDGRWLAFVTSAQYANLSCSLEPPSQVEVRDFETGDYLILPVHDVAALAGGRTGLVVAARDEDFLRVYGWGETSHRKLSPGPEATGNAVVSNASALAVSPDETQLAVGADGVGILVLDFLTGHVMTGSPSLPNPGRVYGLAFSPDSTKLTVAWQRENSTILSFFHRGASGYGEPRGVEFAGWTPPVHRHYTGTNITIDLAWGTPGLALALERDGVQVSKIVLLQDAGDSWATREYVSAQSLHGGLEWTLSPDGSDQLLAGHRDGISRLGLNFWGLTRSMSPTSDASSSGSPAETSSVDAVPAFVFLVVGLVVLGGRRLRK